MVKLKTPRAKHLPRSKDAEALDRAHDALLDAAAKVAEPAFWFKANLEKVSDLEDPFVALVASARAWYLAQQKALGPK